MARSLCFVLMPFGMRSVAGCSIDFDALCRDLIAPAIEDSSLEILRAHEHIAASVLPDSLLEQLMLCDCAIFDASRQEVGAGA